MVACELAWLQWFHFRVTRSGFLLKMPAILTAIPEYRKQRWLNVHQNLLVGFSNQPASEQLDFWPVYDRIRHEHGKNVQSWA